MRRCRRFRCFVDVFVVFSYFSRFLPFKLLSYLRLHLCEDEGMAGLALQSECQEVVLDMDVQDDHDAALVLLGDICLYPQIECKGGTTFARRKDPRETPSIKC
ncbi:hypothetical protein Y032_0021g247 [Ancylostoma ceylanicum]|uniref:Uncharacterized protein n=1 Tax=Ancylostoma ceylanicum TaxID=53326 RepID=A0A016UZB7_9BILA|nr:hypothetical protein Y032_0021g247 [Ancylostoma ceylanicum]